MTCVYQCASYTKVRDLLVELVQPVERESVPLADSQGRILAQTVEAKQSIPPFDRSPYDGYALRGEDTQGATAERPITLNVLEEVPAGAVPTQAVYPGTATKVLTGAPIPQGADAVVMFEKTRFTPHEVTLFQPVKPGSNIVRTGEDVKAGQILAHPGTVIDAATAGTLAGQGMQQVMVYRRPKIGLISTGTEVVEPGQEIAPGQIYNSNGFTITAALQKEGCQVEYLGLAKDCLEEIAAILRRGVEDCDMVVITGGVSVGDYDLTPAAMERIGVELLVRGVALKPGMACAYGAKDGTLVCGLSGNPASAITNLYGVVLPAVRKLCGRQNPFLPEVTVTLSHGFDKPSKMTRLLRGHLDVSDGTVRMNLPKDQGNVVLYSAIGCDVMAVVPAGSGVLEAGTKLKGFLL